MEVPSPRLTPHLLNSHVDTFDNQHLAPLKPQPLDMSFQETLPTSAFPMSAGSFNFLMTPNGSDLRLTDVAEPQSIAVSQLTDASSSSNQAAADAQFLFNNFIFTIEYISDPVSLATNPEASALLQGTSVKPVGGNNQVAHKFMEQKRRAAMTDSFTILSMVLPSDYNDKKKSKATILRNCVNYIEYLKQRHQSLVAELNVWRSTNTQAKMACIELNRQLSSGEMKLPENSQKSNHQTLMSMFDPMDVSQSASISATLMPGNGSAWKRRISDVEFHPMKMIALNNPEPEALTIFGMSNQPQLQLYNVEEESTFFDGSQDDAALF